MKKNTQNFTILHSNDMHGDFLAEVKEGSGKLIGGLALLSGYLTKVREEEEHVIYVIAGDMVQGSLIDSEYKGLSTIEIMNYISPDVVTLGNHELDYGLPHLLFLEKVANFPIVNANLYLKAYGKRLMTPYLIKTIGGFNILFIGIITEKVIDSLILDDLVGTFVSIEEASDEIGKICNAYKSEDIDLTIALTHIGFESDVQLAKLLNPDWGVDMIIGGHSHTILEQPAIVNNILIAQAGYGTDQIGRFDIVVEDETNSIIEWKWELVPINSKTASADTSLEDFNSGRNTHMLQNLHDVAISARQRYRDEFSANEFTLSAEFKETYGACLRRDRQDVDFTAHTAVITTSGNLKMYIPNQWFRAAAYTTQFIQVFNQYKQLLDDILTVDYPTASGKKEYIKQLKESDDPAFSEAFRNRLLALLPDRVQAEEVNATADLLTQFATNYEWWFGNKTIDRGDSYVSPVLSLLSVTNPFSTKSKTSRSVISRTISFASLKT